MLTHFFEFFCRLFYFVYHLRKHQSRIKKHESEEHQKPYYASQCIASLHQVDHINHTTFLEKRSIKNIILFLFKEKAYSTISIHTKSIKKDYWLHNHLF